MQGEGVGLHVVLWLHQYAAFWLPLVTLLFVGGLCWGALHLTGKLLRCGDRREALLRWWRELGGPALVTGVGLILLVSPGWSWPDALIARTDSFFQAFSPSLPTSEPELTGPGPLPAGVDLAVEGMALANMMQQSGELTLLWCGLELVLLMVLFSCFGPRTFRRRRWLFHRPSYLWRLLHCDFPPAAAGLVMVLCAVPGLMVSEWLRHLSPSWPGTLLQAGILLCGTALLICVTRRSGAGWLCRAMLVFPASLMLLRLIWILT